MNDPKIYLKLDKRPKNVKKLIENLYSYKDMGGILYSVETYRNKECTLKQCRAQAYRSPDDIYYLCKTYFPNITIKKVMHELMCFSKLNKSGEYYVMQLSNCGGMGKLRIIPYKINSSYLNIIQKSKYNSKWSWKELLDMLNIKNDEDLKNYRHKHLNK